MAARKTKIDCDEVLPHLFVGSAKASRESEGLSSLGITHILNLAGKQHFPNTFVYKRSFFKDKDGKDETEKGEMNEDEDQILSIAQLREIFQWMDEVFVQNKEGKRNKMMVHCMAGMSRAPSVVIGYLVWSKSFDLPHAFSHVFSVRPRIRPRFLKQVATIEAEVYEMEKERSEGEIEEMQKNARKKKK